MIMNDIIFEWDNHKPLSNEKKHSIHFNEAKTVFFDPKAKVIHDPDHSKDEDRFIILGLSAATRILVVCHCYREDDCLIRIISARKATKRESNQYGGNDHG
jgi:uncharacterized protein